MPPLANKYAYRQHPQHPPRTAPLQTYTDQARAEWLRWAVAERGYRELGAAEGQAVAQQLAANLAAPQQPAAAGPAPTRRQPAAAAEAPASAPASAPTFATGAWGVLRREHQGWQIIMMAAQVQQQACWGVAWGIARRA